MANRYATVVASRLRSQLSYPMSFVLDLGGSALAGAAALVEVYVLFHNVPVLGGLDFSAALLVFALAYVSFGLANAIAGNLDTVPDYIRTGALDVLLLRPMPVLAQLLTAELTLRRIGQALLALAVLPIALVRSEIDWTPARLLLVVVAPLCGTLIFGAIFLFAGAMQFWLLDGAEFTNAATYGGSYAASLPASVMPVPLRVFFTFVVPASFVGYLPTLALVPEAATGALPSWLGWCLPVAALVSCGVALLAWRAGLRRYEGAGG